jgi:putative endonuclease
MNNNRATGNKGEEMAAQYLVQQGYTIVERNWRYKYWEVDIIANKDKRLHFIEIKTRTSDKFGNPEESISKKKMINLRNAAEEYQYMHPEWNYVQFDVLAITMYYNKPVEYFFIEDVYF